jgi:hypothetical protein
VPPEEENVPRRQPRQELEDLRARIQRARWRVRTAAYGGPEWDAATAHLAELEEEYRRLSLGGRKPPARG